MRKFLFTLLFISNIVFAIDKVFIREYTYKASDYDSKVTARVNALEQVTEQLLREVGVYIKSETKFDSKETNDGIEKIFEKKMNVITAGITKIEVIDEKWTGIEYWVKAKVKLNPKDVLKQIDALVNNKEKFDQYEQLEKDKNQANKEIERLREELANVKSKNEQLELSKLYNKEVDKLSAQDWFSKAYTANNENKDIEKAMSFYITSIELDPEYTAAYNNLGILYYNQDKYEQAETNYLKAIALDPEYAIAYSNLGILYKNQGKYEQAETNYLKAIALDPENAIVYVHLGILYKNQDKYEQAETNYLKAIALDPEYAIAYSNLGILYYNQDKYEQAETNYLKAIALDPEYAIAYSNLGILYYNQDKYEQAETNYLKAIALDPEYAIAYSNLGILYYNQDKYEQAETNYLKAIALDPENAIVYVHLGILYKNQDKYEQAETNYLKAIALDPEYAIAYNNLGVVYHNSDFTLALKYYRKAAQLGNQSIQKWLKDNGYTW